MASHIRKQATPKQVFWAAWLGWMLDGFDLSIFVFVLVPAVTELLMAEGMDPTQGNIARYGGYLLSIFMLGWACSMLWGWAADRFGRVRIMSLTIVWYSIATALCGLATSLEMLLLFRFLAGFGVGGEWAAGTTLVQESVPEHLRIKYAGWLHTATPVGILLASAASLLVPVLGWRGLFFIGILPAFLTVYLRYRIPEPEAWTQPSERRMSGQIQTLFRGRSAHTAWTAAAMMAVVILGLWSSTFWAPTLIATEARADGLEAGASQRLVAYSGILMNVGTLLACLLMPAITRVLGTRRRTATAFFLGSLCINTLAYGLVVLVLDELALFMALLPAIGFFTNGVFALYTIWLPEMFPTALRASGAGFAFSMGRVLGAAGPSIVGALIAITHSMPLAILTMSIVYLIGLPAVFRAKETANQALLSRT